MYHSTQLKNEVIRWPRRTLLWRHAGLNAAAIAVAIAAAEEVTMAAVAHSLAAAPSQNVLLPVARR